MMLEIGAVPLNFIIKKNRIIYCHKLLTSSDKNLAKLVLEQQIQRPVKNDFVIYVKDDLKDFGLPTENFEDLKNYSIREFKKLVTKNMYKVAFDFLIGEKTKLKKGRLNSFCPKN